MILKNNPVVFFILSLSLLKLTNHINNYFDPLIGILMFYIVLFFFISSSYYLVRDFKFESNYFRTILYVFFIYEIVILARGFTENDMGFTTMDEFYSFIRGYYLLWPLIIPVFVFFDKRISNFVILFDWIYYVTIGAMVLLLLMPEFLMDRTMADNYLPGLTYASGIMLLFSTYLKEKKVNTALALMIVVFVAFTYLARRNSMVTVGGFIVFAYFLNIRSRFRPSVFKLFPVILIMGVAFLINSSSVLSSLTSKINDRLNEDTRSDLLVAFFADMDGNTIFGKGLGGTYYYPSGGELEDEGVVFQEVEYRDIIETGYLQLFLNGGLAHVLLFLLILIPAAYNGIFRSNNLMVKGFGTVIFLWLIDMFVYGLPFISFHYIFVWISVGVCFRPSMRNMSDDEVREVFLELAK